MADQRAGVERCHLCRNTLPRAVEVLLIVGEPTALAFCSVVCAERFGEAMQLRRYGQKIERRGRRKKAA